MKTNKKGKRFIAIGLLLLIAALCLVVYNLYDSMRAASAANEAALALQQEMGNGQDDYKNNSDIEMPGMDFDNHNYVAIIEIPALNVVLPVIDQWSYPDLKVAPCRYSGSAYSNDLVIAAHNYRQHFGRIKELDQGDEVYVVDMDGNVFAYQVALVETLQATAVEEMKSSDWDLTMFTCTVGGQARVTVRCVKQ